MFMMKFEHFQEGVVGYIPENGFRGEGRSNSVFALKYLQWLNELDPALRIRHPLNGGEKIIKGESGCYYVDGYSKTHDRAYEVSVFRKIRKRLNFYRLMGACGTDAQIVSRLEIKNVHVVQSLHLKNFICTLWIVKKILRVMDIK